MNSPKRVIIISFDAMGARDLDFMGSLPNFKKFMEKAAICRNVASVYPSVTYPAHTSIITGRMPKNHGVVNNTLLQPGRPTPDWMWQRRYIKGTTLYDEVIKKGWKVAALLWPVTAKSKIQYNVPEVLANRPWQNQIIVSALNGSLLYELLLNKKFGKLRDGVRQPALDNFTQASALYTIQKYNPDMMLIHLTDLDTNRHIYGLDHAKAKEAMRRHDTRLGELLQAAGLHVEGGKTAKGALQDTTVILLGDHCQLDTKQIVYFNYLLREKGLLKTKGDKITAYQVIAKNCDGSCYFYLHPKYKNDVSVLNKLTEVIEEISKDVCFGVERVFSGEEAGVLGADDTCAYMIEAKEGYYYLDEFETLTRSVNEEKKHKMRAAHGYLPSRDGYKTFFMAAGCGINEGVQIDQMNLWDEGVTLAKLLGVDLGKTDGKVITELLK